MCWKEHEDASGLCVCTLHADRSRLSIVHCIARTHVHAQECLQAHTCVRAHKCVHAFFAQEEKSAAMEEAEAEDGFGRAGRMAAAEAAAAAAAVTAAAMQGGWP